jgi:hypothetical protein
VLTLFAAGLVAAAPPAAYADEGKSAVVAGNLPQGILAFRRGLDEHPGDRELGDLLEAARDLVPYPPPAEAAEKLRPAPPGTWERWVGAWELTAIGVGATALFAFGVAARLTARPRWAVPVAVIGLLGFLGVVTVFAWSRETDGPVAVVRPEKGAVLRTGNSDYYPSRTAFPLPRGAEVTVLGHRGGWVLLPLPHRVPAPPRGGSDGAGSSGRMGAGSRSDAGLNHRGTDKTKRLNSEAAVHRRA